MKIKVIVIVLTLLNLILIYFFIKADKEVQLNKYDLINYGLEVMKETARDSILNKAPSEGMFGLVFINQNGCLMCVKHDVTIINEKKELQKRIVIIFIGYDSEFLTGLGAEFEFLTFTSLDEIYGNPIPLGNPFSVLLDKNFVYDLNITDTSKPHSERLRKSHYNFLKALLIEE